MRPNAQKRGTMRERRTGKGARKRLAITAYALWVVLILVASVPYLAETATRKAMEDGTFTYHPTFTKDGEKEHYEDVERADTSRKRPSASTRRGPRVPVRASGRGIACPGDQDRTRPFRAGPPRPASAGVSPPSSSMGS